MEIQPVVYALKDATAIERTDPRPAAPSASAAAQFAQLMAPDDPVPADAIARVPIAASPSGPTMGDAILSGLRSVSDDMSSKWSAVSKALDAPNLQVAHMLKLQLTISQMSVQYDLVGKAISRSTQNIDQLVKLQ